MLLNNQSICNQSINLHVQSSFHLSTEFKVICIYFGFALLNLMIVLKTCTTVSTRQKKNQNQLWQLASLHIDYEQSRFFLIVCQERSEKNRLRESWPRGSWWQGRQKKGTTDKASAFDLSQPSDFMVFISNLINRNRMAANYFPYLDMVKIGDWPTRLLRVPMFVACTLAVLLCSVFRPILLLTCFFWGQYICALLFGGVSRKTVFLANVQRSYICWLLFDFGTSVNCYMFCSRDLFGSFLFARHVISFYIILSGRTMFNLNRYNGLFAALSNSKWRHPYRMFGKYYCKCVRCERLTIVFVWFCQRLL